MSENISENKILSELDRFNPVATTMMLSRHMNVTPNKLSDRLRDMRKKGKVGRLSLEGKVGWYIVKEGKIDFN